MDAGTSRREFICRTLFGAGIGGLLSSVRAASNLAKTDSRLVDRRRLGRTGADVSILGLGLGAAFMEQSLGTAHALLESALAKGINYWDTGRSYGPSEEMIAPVLERNRNRVFLASKSDARDYEGFKSRPRAESARSGHQLHRFVSIARFTAARVGEFERD